MDATPLAGLRVLDLGGGLSSTYAAKVLNDLGATVTFVEIRAGDPARRSHDVGVFRYLRAGTRSLLADVDDETDLRRVDAEIEAADLVIESFGRAAWTALDVPPPRPGSPQVRAHISPYGWDGPAADRAATGFVLQAASGWLDRSRNPAGVPMQVGGDIDQLAAGVFAAAGSLVALFEVRRRRQPVDVHVSRFECLVSSIPYPMVHHAVFEPHGWSIPRQARQFPGLVATADGWVIVSPLHTRNWNDLCQVIGVPEFADRLVDLAVDDDTRGEFLAATRDWFARQSADELVEQCQALRIPAARAADATEIVRDPQVLARGSLIPQPGDTAVHPRPPWRFSRSSVPGARPAPDQDATCAPPPRQDRWSDQPLHLGTAESLSSWGGGRPGLPCSGLRVLDLTAYWAGPYTTSFLASQGADVLKIESHRRPDGFRYSMSAPELGDAWWEFGAAWISTNLGKRSVTLDLQSEQGRGLVRQLVSTADVLIESFTPRVLPHLGLDPEELLVHHPSLAILRMPGFGLEGPARDYVGWAPTLECGRDGCRHRRGGRSADPAEWTCRPAVRNACRGGLARRTRRPRVHWPRPDRRSRAARGRPADERSVDRRLHTLHHAPPSARESQRAPRTAGRLSDHGRRRVGRALGARRRLGELHRAAGTRRLAPRPALRHCSRTSRAPRRARSRHPRLDPAARSRRGRCGTAAPRDPGCSDR